VVASGPVLLPKAGTMGQQQANAYVDALEKASTEGPFFSANHFYTYIARRP
jgi:hypothetical protein